MKKKPHFRSPNTLAQNTI